MQLNRVILATTAFSNATCSCKSQHSAVRILQSTPGSPCATPPFLPSIAQTSRCKLALPAAAASCTREEHKIAAPQHRCLKCKRFWPLLRPNGCLASCRRAGHAAAGRQALAATICQQPCGMLESNALVRMLRSAQVTRKVVAQRDAQQRSRQGAWRPTSMLRATSRRPCRVDAPATSALARLTLDVPFSHDRLNAAHSRLKRGSHTRLARAALQRPE